MLIFYWNIRYTEVQIENEHVMGGFKGNIADLLPYRVDILLELQYTWCSTRKSTRYGRRFAINHLTSPLTSSLNMLIFHWNFSIPGGQIENQHIKGGGQGVYKRPPPLTC